MYSTFFGECSSFKKRSYLSQWGFKAPEQFKVIKSDNLLSSAKGKIRYISGYVIAKIKHNLSIKIRNSLFAEGLVIFNKTSKSD